MESEIHGCSEILKDISKDDVLRTNFIENDWMLRHKALLRLQ